MATAKSLTAQEIEKVLVYIAQNAYAERNKLMLLFQKRGMEPHEAAEWIEYNILGAYVGERTPMIMFPMKPKECIEHLTDGDEE